MKKKPEVVKGTGKSSLTLRNFLNNLKENDLHYENKQITQCVFLGVLRLKPVPSIFSSNNVPSVSAPVNENTAKTSETEVKASSGNKKVNKNLPKKNDISKGKIAKKNPQNIKDAVKKVPVKKSSDLKIKSSGKKKVTKDDDTNSSTNDEQETSGLPTEVSPTIASHAFLSGPTIRLTPIMSPTKFNPVQNLFDKLKQKIDEKNNEPSTSKMKKQTHKAKEVSESNVTPSKVCKINAKRSVKIVSIKKAKQLLHKKPGLYEGLHLVSTKTPSPITISDTESTSKKDEDDITIITDDSNSSSSFNQEIGQHTEARDGGTEDIIFVHQDPKQKNKTRTSPRHKAVNEGDVIEKQSIVATTQIVTKTSNNSTPRFTQAEDKIRETKQSNDIIVISEDLATKENPSSSSGKRQNSDEEGNGSRNDVIIIDEVRGTRVSPRLKKVEETKQKNKEIEKSDSDVIFINEDVTSPKINVPSTDHRSLSDSLSKSKQLDIMVDEEQSPNDQSKTSPKLLKVVENPEKSTFTVKRELIESVSDVTPVNEKPKQKRNKPLLPPVLLTPMLLRSELAQKKSNPSATFGKSRASSSREKSSQRLLRSDLEQTKFSKKATKSHIKSSTRLLRSELQNLKNTPDTSCVDSVGNITSLIEDKQSPPTQEPSSVSENPPPFSSDTNPISYSDISAEDYYSSQKSEIEEESSKLDVFLLKEENNLNVKISPRLLRSDSAKQKSLENFPSDNKEDISIKNEHEAILVDKQAPKLLAKEGLISEDTELGPTEPELNKSPTKHDSKISKQTDDDIIFINDESSKAIPSRCLRSDISRPKKTNTEIEEIVVISDNTVSSQKDNHSSKLRPEVNQQVPQAQQSDVIDLDKIIVVNDHTSKKSRDRSNGRLLRSELAQQNAKQKSPIQMDMEKTLAIVYKPKSKEELPESSEMQHLSVSNIGSAQEEFVEERKRKSERSSPRSSKTDKTQRQSSDNLPSEVRAIIDDFTRDEPVVVKHTTSSRLLRSEIVSQPSQDVMAHHENSAPFRLSRSDVPDKLPQQVSCSLSSVAAEENETSVRVLRSETVSAQNSPEPQTQPDIYLSKISSPSQEMMSNPSKEICVSIEIVEDGDIEQVTSYQMLPPEVGLHKKPKKHSNVQGEHTDEEKRTSRLLRSEVTQNISKRHYESYEIMDNKAREKYPFRRRRSLLRDLKLKQKSSMLLRSELAQMRTVSTSSSIPEAAQETRNGDVNATSVNIEAQPVTTEIAEQTPVETVHIGSPRRKNLIDDIKKKTVKEQENILPILEDTDQSINTDVAQPTAVYHCTIQNKNEVTIPDSNKTEEICKRKRSPRITKLSRNDNQRVGTPHSDIDISGETKVELDEVESPKIPKEAEESEIKAKEETASDTAHTPSNRKSIDINDDSTTEIPDVLNNCSPLSPKQPSSHKTSPKESKVIEGKKLSPKEKTSSPKRKSRETVPDQIIKVEESPVETSEQEGNITEVHQGTPRKQKRSPTQGTPEEVKNSKVNDISENQDQSSQAVPLEGNNPPKRKSPPKRKVIKTSIDVQEKSQELVETIVVAETSDNNIIIVSPKSSRPGHKPSRERSVEKVVEIADDIPEVSASTEPTEVLKSKVNQNQSSKQNKQRKKPTMKTKSKANKARTIKAVANIRPRRARIGANTLPPKQKKQTKKLTKTKVIEENVSEENICQKEIRNEAVVSSPTANDLNSNEKSVASPTRGRKKKAKNIEKAVVKVENENYVGIKLEIEDSCKNAEVQKVPPTENGGTFGTISEINEPKTNARKRQASPAKGKAKKPKRGQKAEVEKISHEATPNDVEVSLEVNANKAQKTKQKRKTGSAKKRTKISEDKPAKESASPPEKVEVNSPKKMDITVFDFDESEPEVIPLRLSSTSRKSKVVVGESNDITSTARPQKAKTKPNTKAQAKSKLLAMFKGVAGMSSGGTEEDSVEATSEGLSTVSDADANGKTSPTKTSPLKQATITDMFNKAPVKRELLGSDVFDKDLPPGKPTGENVIADMPPPKFEGKLPLPPPPRDDSEENEYYDEEDSDCESRMEWIPEEYAEYKFKYSAKKMMRYKPVHKCKICLLTMPSYYRLTKHKLEHAKKENPYNCMQCEQVFSSIDELTAHLRLHKGKHPYTCNKCDIGFWSKKALDAHTPIHVLRKVKQPNKRFRCDVCAKEFSKLCDMERHTRVHTGEKPCICNICNKRFQQSHNLSKHLLTHLHVKPYHCEICNKKFGRNDVLNRHLLTHSVKKPINCTYCQKGFIRQSQLNNHTKKHHPDAVKIEETVEASV